MSIVIYAHRGASKNAPENTMGAFKLANEQGAMGIETDVHFTKDLIPVLIHDQTIDRTTNGSGRVSDYTFDELLKFDAGSWFSHRFFQEKIVRLDILLQWIRETKLQLNLELKINRQNKYLEEIIYSYLKNFDVLDRTIVSSFCDRTIKSLSEKKDLKTAFISSRWHWNLPNFTRNLKADGLHIPFRLLTKRIMKQAKETNVPIRVYTINSKRRMLRCIQYNCQAIFTDVPKRILQFKKRSSF